MEDMYLRIGGSLIVLLGAGCAFGAYVLWNGAPESWTDVLATEIVVRRTARVLVALSIMLLASGVACILPIPWAREIGSVATLVFVVGGFFGNHALFGNLRPTHTGTNLLVATAILWLLW